MCYSSRSRENDLLQNQVKLSENRDFLPKMGFINQNFRVIGVIVPPLPRHFRVIGVIAVIPAKMTFCRIDYFQYPKKFFCQKTKTLFLRKFRISDYFF